ncbi:MAG: hypothetical protein LBE34_02365 [Flavobacteriaceae bacterium]|nr:hypothetical protein [Flavobacteriaceae bacterium]
MKYLIGVILILVNYNCLNAQNCKSIGENLISKIKKTNYKDLLPYYDSKVKKWGLMDRYGNALTEPFEESIYIFKTNLHMTYFITNYKGCDINISYVDMKFSAKKTEKQDDEYCIGEFYKKPTSDYETLKGFTVEPVSIVTLKTEEVEKRGEISKFSKQFKQVNDLFYFNEKWYALAVLKDGSLMGIIDQNGEAIKHFNFNYKKLKQLDYYRGIENNEIWYYYEDLLGNKGFINLFGETIMKGELLSECLFYKDYFCVQKNDVESGVLDLRTLKWIIKPQKERKFQNIIEFGDYGNDYCNYYFIVKEGEEQYLMDVDMKVYKRINTNKK